jgi:hypothetical protein
VLTFSRVRYAVDYDRVHFKPKPHDCAFLSAPLGSKNCHWDKIVEVVMWRQSPPGASQRSYDGGKTWVTIVAGECVIEGVPGVSCNDEFDPPVGAVPVMPTVTGVRIQWSKVVD